MDCSYSVTHTIFFWATSTSKPVFFSLAVDGRDGLRNVFRLLKKEIETAMALCGVANVQEISQSLVCRHPSGGSLSYYQRAKL
jgi:isopentenyl diphosphate isomerase/L-lactate dehydrogenase-like FMN-dependent dehydrogenase